jgi:peptidoglycan/LPS O-acetylase OafA/YrhL
VKKSRFTEEQIIAILREQEYRYTLSYYAALGLFLLFTTRAKINHPFFHFLGRVSYSVYLLGPIVQELIFFALPPPMHRGIPGHVYILATMILTVLLSWICYVLVEKPAIAEGKRLSAWLDSGKRRRSPATEVI